MAEPKKTPGLEIVEQVLPLVLEIIPGQAADGLIDIYEPGSHEGQTLRKLCERTLNKKDWSIEGLQILEEIRRQLEGGRPCLVWALSGLQTRGRGGWAASGRAGGSFSTPPAVTMKMGNSEEERV